MGKNDKTIKVIKQGDSFAAPYMLGFLGAAIYFIQQVDGFWLVIWAILKALVWPAYLVYHAFEFMAV